MFFKGIRDKRTPPPYFVIKYIILKFYGVSGPVGEERLFYLNFVASSYRTRVVTNH